MVELLGRSAPTAGTMLGNATVSAAMSAAFTASNPAITLPPHDPAQPVGACNPPAGTPPPAGVHEEGGWIYMNLITGDLDTRRAAGGGQANINLGGPPDVVDSIVVGTFHTHPNVGPCWGAVFPSGTDTNSANSTGRSVAHHRRVPRCRDNANRIHRTRAETAPRRQSRVPRCEWRRRTAGAPRRYARRSLVWNSFFEGWDPVRVQHIHGGPPRNSAPGRGLHAGQHGPVQ